MGFFSGLGNFLSNTISSAVGSIPGVGGFLSDAVNGISKAIGIDDASIAHAQANEDLRNVMDRQEGFTMQMAQQTHDWNVEDWQRNNEYNSPLAQRQRMMQAGLNPNLYEGGQMSPSSAVSSPLPSAPAAPASTVGQLAQLSMVDAQRRNIEADTRLKTIDSDWRDLLHSADYQGKLVNNDYVTSLKVQIEHATKKIDSDIAVNQSYIDKLVSDKNVNEQTAQKIFLDNLMMTQTWKTQVQLLTAKLHMTNAQATEFLSQAALCNSQQQAAELANEWARRTMDYRVGQEKQKQRSAEGQADNIYYDNEIKQFRNNFIINNEDDIERAAILTTLFTSASTVIGAGATLGLR